MDTQQVSAPQRGPSPVRRGATPSSGIVHDNLPHTSRYTVVGNHLAQHRELSLLAIGIAVHIQSLPTGAKVGIAALADRHPESEHRIAAALRELEAHGYLERTRERLPNGRVITCTVSYNQPGTVPRPAAAPGPHPEKPVQPVRPVSRPAPAPAAAPTLAPEPAAVPASAPEPAAGLTPTPEPDRKPAPLPVRMPELPPNPEPDSEPDPNPEPGPGPNPDPTRHPQAPPSLLSRPHTHESAHQRPATDLLAGLRRHDPRLLLSEREVRRLTPAVTTWLERGIDPESVSRALTTHLPHDRLTHPAGLLAHRLTEHLPPPLPAIAAPGPVQGPDPLQNCDRCDRAHRAPEPGNCPGCRSEQAAAA